MDIWKILLCVYLGSHVLNVFVVTFLCQKNDVPGANLTYSVVEKHTIYSTALTFGKVQRFEKPVEGSLNTLKECEMIANNTFTIISNAPLTDGIWRATASCNTFFPYKTYNANQAWMFTRFGVPISNYQDYLAGNSIEIDPDKKWVISRIGYGSGGSSLSYSLQFEYDVWLGTGVPSGDCHQFTDLQMAKDFAASASILSDTPADTLISLADLAITSTGHSGSQGLCQFVFPGIIFGPREAVILVSFTVPVTYQGDYVGNTVLHAADDSTWYIVQYTYSGQSSISYTMNFNFQTSDTDISSAYCSLYVSEGDAVSASSSLSQTTTNAATTSVLPTSYGGYTSPKTTSTSTPPTNVALVIMPHTPRSNKTAGYLYEAQGMRNQYVPENNLWIKETASLLHCGRLCLADDSCVSVFHQEASSECTAHSVVYGNGYATSGVQYYVLK